MKGPGSQPRDGQRKARCSGTEDGNIVDVNGRTLCSNWNQTIGCKDKSARHIYERSGCGEYFSRYAKRSLADH